MTRRDEILGWLRQADGVITDAARAHGMKRTTLRDEVHKLDLRDEVRAIREGAITSARGDAAEPPSDIGERILKAIRKEGLSAAQLADKLDVSPRRIREATAELRAKGYRIPDAEDTIRLERVAPAEEKIRKLDPRLLDGDLIRVGVVSDTHISSKEEALDELHLAYDHFAAEGISEVWHSGDHTCGKGIFPGQDREIKVHTYDGQVDRLVDVYPQRDGIKTVTISGNHDLEGQFGRSGADPVQAFAARREDIDYIGLYSGRVELPNGAHVHLLHGKGGMSYAYSYKAQKLVDGYPGGHKPAVLIPGHWHVRGAFEARGVQVLFPGCFEWRSPFLERLGLHPAVGFHVLEMKLADDGSVVEFAPRWKRIWQGRVVG